MNVSLTTELEEFAEELVSSGRYNSRSEVVREALRLLQDREQLRKLKHELLREEIEKGLDSGTATPLDMKSIKEEARKRWEAENENAG